MEKNPVVFQYALKSIPKNKLAKTTSYTVKATGQERRAIMNLETREIIFLSQKLNMDDIKSEYATLVVGKLGDTLIVHRQGITDEGLVF